MYKYSIIATYYWSSISRDAWSSGSTCCTIFSRVAWVTIPTRLSLNKENIEVL